MVHSVSQPEDLRLSFAKQEAGAVEVKESRGMKEWHVAASGWITLIYRGNRGAILGLNNGFVSRIPPAKAREPRMTRVWLSRIHDK